MNDSKREPEPTGKDGATLPLWEVFVQEGAGEPHTHAGSIHAADGELALQSARDVFARRSKLESLWVIPAAAIVATRPSDSGPFFDPAEDKVYRHPQFYKVPRGIKAL